MDNKQGIYKQLVGLSVVLGQEQRPERLNYYADNLKKYDLEKVKSTIKKISLSSKFFPQLAEIIEKVEEGVFSSEDMATQIASEVIECISKFGPYQVKELKEYLGDKFELVNRFGGWGLLCNITNNEIPATRAQLRELAKAYLGKSKKYDNAEILDFKNSSEKKSNLKLIKIEKEIL